MDRGKRGGLLLILSNTFRMNSIDILYIIRNLFQYSKKKPLIKIPAAGAGECHAAKYAVYSQTLLFTGARRRTAGFASPQHNFRKPKPVK
jgi:hypothetical protein